ncbi:MAG: class I SAM-dependent methyltransferase [Elusimicrobia bacterium]|nr:class I SAM-dependent methyltransferase [Elusimicrobiota bacterium]
MTPVTRSSPNDPQEWDAWAASYSSDVDWLEAIHDPDLRELLAPAGKRVVDAGCGTGRRARAVLAGAAAVLAVDFSEAMSQAARMELSGVSGAQVLRLDLEREDLPGAGSFDAAMAVSVMHHIADPAAFLGRLKLALRPGGRLVLVDHVAGRPLRELARYYGGMFLAYNPVRLAGAFLKGFAADTMLSRHKKREAQFTLEEFSGRYSGLLPGCRVETRHGIFAYLIWDKP